MNLRDVRSSAVPVKAKPEPTGTRYDAGNGNVLEVRKVKPYASGNARYAACTVFADGSATEMTGIGFAQPAFSRAQRVLDAYAKRAGYGVAK